MTKLLTRGEFRTDRFDLSALLAQAAEPGVITIDPMQRIVGLNSSAERLIQMSAAAALGRSMEMLPSPLRDVVKETWKTDAGMPERPLVLRSEGKGKAIVFASTVMVRGAMEQGIAVLVTLHDLTAAREFEMKTERLQRLAQLGVLSAGVAHEIKNALVAIKSFAEWLLEKDSLEQDMVSLVVQEVDRISTLVGQLLKLAGPAKTVFVEFKAHESIENALRLIKHQLKNRDIKLRVALEAGCDTIRGDAKQLEQALINLLMNAVEAMGESGELTVSTEVVFATELVSKFEPRLRRQQLEITIRDTGSGIPARVLEQLYAPFRTTKAGGTGLGLAITRRILMAHNGRIAVESEVGNGTSFKLTLPLARRTPATDLVSVTSTSSEML
jgi:signal transduction histidine kinase